MNGTSIQSDVSYWLRQDNTVNHLLFWNILIFLLLGIARLISYISPSSGAVFGFLYDQVAFHSAPAAFIRHPWGLLTYMFSHVAIFHVLFNMLNLYWFGNLFRSFLGNRRVLPLYLLGGIVGALLFMGSYFIINPGVDSTMIGASASVMCMLIACATLMPNYEIGLLFIGAVRLKWLAIAIILLDVISIPDGNMGGIIAHLGGALLGFSYIKILQSGTDLCQPLILVFEKIATLRAPKPANKSNRSFKPKKSPLKVVKKQDENKQLRLDLILDKINEKGMHSLSPEEKAWLDKMSQE